MHCQILTHENGYLYTIQLLYPLVPNLIPQPVWILYNYFLQGPYVADGHCTDAVTSGSDTLWKSDCGNFKLDDEPCE